MSANKSLAREAYEAAQDAYDRVVASAYRACDELIDARDDYRNHVSRLSAQRYEQALTHYKIAVAEVKRAGDEVERSRLACEAEEKAMP